MIEGHMGDDPAPQQAELVRRMREVDEEERARQTYLARHSVARPFRRVALPAALALAAWLFFWLIDNYCLRQIALGLGRSNDSHYLWPQIPAVASLPRFGWLLFPVLLLCIHLSAAVGGKALDRAVIVLGPLVVAPFVYWKSLSGLVWITPMSQTSWEAVLLVRGRWSVVFFAPEYLALVLTCVSALALYALAERVMGRRQDT